MPVEREGDAEEAGDDVVILRLEGREGDELRAAALLAGASAGAGRPRAVGGGHAQAVELLLREELQLLLDGRGLQDLGTRDADVAGLDRAEGVGPGHRPIPKRQRDLEGPIAGDGHQVTPHSYII